MRSLWLPIVLSAAVVWFLSIVASATQRRHRGDFRALSEAGGGEDGLMDDFRCRGIPPGNYAAPSSAPARR